MGLVVWRARRILYLWGEREHLVHRIPPLRAWALWFQPSILSVARDAEEFRNRAGGNLHNIAEPTNARWRLVWRADNVCAPLAMLAGRAGVVSDCGACRAQLAPDLNDC